MRPKTEQSDSIDQWQMPERTERLLPPLACYPHIFFNLEDSILILHTANYMQCVSILQVHYIMKTIYSEVFNLALVVSK